MYSYNGEAQAHWVYMKGFDKKKLLFALKKLFKGASGTYVKMRQKIPLSEDGLTKTFFRYIGPIKQKVTETTTFFRLPEKLTKENRTSKLGRAIRKIAEKYSFDDISKRLFDPRLRPTIHRVFLIVTVCSIAYMGGRTLVLFLSSYLPGAVGSAKQTVFFPDNISPEEIISIGNVDLFKAEGQFSKVPINNPDEATACLEAHQKSSLPVKLVHSIVLMDSVKSLASVQVRNDEDLLGLREGDRIQTMAKVDKIENHRIIVKNFNNGECEYIQGDAALKKGRGRTKSLTVLDPNEGDRVMREQSDGSIVNVGNTFKIQKSLRTEMLDNISEVLTQARAIQITNPDGTLSFRMTEIEPGSIYSKLNIQDGDIITGINGKNFTNIGELMELFGKIKEIDQFQVTFDREGASQTLEYNFE